MASKPEFENLVDRYYVPLYRFALSLSAKENDARDLTQQTFYLWAVKGHHLRDPSKVKAWLFTTLYREFLQGHRREARFPHQELDEMNEQLPNVDPRWMEGVDAAAAVAALGQIQPVFKGPLALFYLEDYSYKEIADILDIPVGTVKSRISRGIAQLQNIFAKRAGSGGQQKGDL